MWRKRQKNYVHVADRSDKRHTISMSIDGEQIAAALVELVARSGPIGPPCPHARPSWRQCPHCLGLNDETRARAIDGMERLSEATEREFGEEASDVCFCGSPAPRRTGKCPPHADWPFDIDRGWIPPPTSPDDPSSIERL